MKLIFTTLILTLLIIGCDSKKPNHKLTNTSVSNYEEVKQQIKDLRQSEIEFLEYYNSSLGNVPEEQLNKKRDSHYDANCDIIKSIFSDR